MKRDFRDFVLSDEFRNILNAKELNRLDIAFIGFYGSRNYGISSDGSDYDFFAAYYPEFKDFFNHKFERFSELTERYDYFITPVHDYVHHAMRGNVKFIEPLMCSSIFFIEKDEEGKINITDFSKRRLKYFNLLKNYILNNYEINFNAAIGLSNNKKLNIVQNRYTSATLCYKEIYDFDIKEAINSFRTMYLIENYVKNRNFDFMVKDNYVYKDFEAFLTGIKNKKISKEDFLIRYEEKMSGLLKLKDEVKFRSLEAKSILLSLKEQIKESLIEECKYFACGYKPE